jgi:hypothetical protein
VRPIEQPKVLNTPDDPCDDSKTTHPAFGNIRASRYSGGSGAMYGSSFLHSGGVSITISRSTLHRGLSRDNYFGGDELISVDLTEAQWATFVSNLNGSGNPCTLRHIGRKMVPGLPDPPDMSGQYAAEMNETVKEIQVALRQLAENPKLPQWARKDISMQAARLTNSTGFIAEQFGEHVETVVEHAKIEINAYVTQTVARAGLEHLGVPPLALAPPKGDK